MILANCWGICSLVLGGFVFISPGRPALGPVREILLLSKWYRTGEAGSTAVPGIRDPHPQGSREDSG